MHSLRQTKIREACASSYPRLADDIDTAPSERGLLSLIGDHLIELDFLSNKGKASVDGESDKLMKEDDESLSQQASDSTNLLQSVGHDDGHLPQHVADSFSRLR